MNMRTGTESIDGSESNTEDGDERTKLQRKVVRTRPSRQTLAKRKPVEVYGSRTLAGRIEKKQSSSSLRRKADAFDVRNFKFPRDEEIDCAVQSDDNALIHNKTPQRSRAKVPSSDSSA